MKKRKVFSIVEIKDFKRFLSELKKERDKLVLKILFFTGMRVSELCYLKKSDIQL